jgi:hypothetical protein
MVQCTKTFIEKKEKEFQRCSAPQHVHLFMEQELKGEY